MGGGTAGSVVANRLTETGASVLVLEAGESAPSESAVPGLIPLLLGSKYDWNLRMAPQTNTQQGYRRNVMFLYTLAI